MNDIIKTFGGVRGYEKNDVVYLHIEDVARGLGITSTTSKDGTIYTNIRWSRVDELLGGLNFLPQVAENGNPHDYYIPENIFYRLCMKARNEVAEAFQAKVADEIIPSIRKNGVYATDNFIQKSIEDPDWAISMLQQLKFEREQKQLALQQRDEAIRTKAQIGARREATAMNTASQKSKECERLRERIGNSLQWRQAKAVTWAKEYFSIKMCGFWSAFGKFLSKISRQMSVEIRKIKCDDAGDCQKFDRVNEYHMSVINNAKMLLDGGGLFDDYIDAKILALIVTYRK